MSVEGQPKSLTVHPAKVLLNGEKLSKERSNKGGCLKRGLGGVRVKEPKKGPPI